MTNSKSQEYRMLLYIAWFIEICVIIAGLFIAVSAFSIDLSQIFQIGAGPIAIMIVAIAELAKIPLVKAITYRSIFSFSSLIFISTLCLLLVASGLNIYRGLDDAHNLSQREINKLEVQKNIILAEITNVNNSLITVRESSNKSALESRIDQIRSDIVIEQQNIESKKRTFQQELDKIQNEIDRTANLLSSRNYRDLQAKLGVIVDGAYGPNSMAAYSSWLSRQEAAKENILNQINNVSTIRLQNLQSQLDELQPKLTEIDDWLSNNNAEVNARLFDLNADLLMVDRELQDTLNNSQYRRIAARYFGVSNTMDVSDDQVSFIVQIFLILYTLTAILAGPMCAYAYYTLIKDDKSLLTYLITLIRTKYTSMLTKKYKSIFSENIKNIKLIEQTVNENIELAKNTLAIKTEQNKQMKDILSKTNTTNID